MKIDSRRPRVLGLLVALVVLASAVGTAAAQSAELPLDAAGPCAQNPLCKQYYEEALNEFKQGNHDKALGRFQSALAQSPEPLIRVYIGRCLFALGDAQRALDVFQNCQIAVPAPSPEVMAELQKHTAIAQEALARKPATPTAVTASSEPRTGTPFYRAGWFWAVTTITAAGLALGLGLGFGLQQVPSAHETVQWTR